MFDGMTMYSHTANCAMYLAGGVPKTRPAASSKPWPSIAIPYSVKPSLVFQTEGNENHPPDPTRNFVDQGTSSPMGSSPSSPLLSHGDTVGVMGGVSAISTIRFLEKLVKWSLKSGGECPPLLACSDPVLSRELLQSERNSLPYTRLRHSAARINRELIVQNLKKRRSFLEESGARCIVMPCHLSYAWYDDIRFGCSVPFLHVGECVAKELVEAKLKPVETGSNVRIGILSPDPAFTAGYYREKLENQGFEVVVPDEATMEHTVLPAIEALNRKDIEGARNLLRISLQVLLVRAVNTIILASDEMRGVLPPSDPLLKKCTDPMDVMARAAVQWVRSQSG